MKRFLIALFVLASSSAARASCGLSVCDVAGSPGLWRAEVKAFRVAYDLDGFSGSYLQTAVTVGREGRSWRLGGTASLVSNSPDAGHHKTGLGNPVLKVEHVRGPWAAGLLAEIPWGDDANGLAGDHAAAVPYAAWRPSRGAWRADLRAGYSHSLTEGHGAHAAAGGHSHVLVVNPHADREIVYRSAVMNHRERVSAEAFLDGHHALKGESDGKGFLTAGLAIDALFGKGFSAGIWGEVPLTRPRRMESRVGLRAGKTF